MFFLEKDSFEFPDPLSLHTHKDGPLATGGNLQKDNLWKAYLLGIFPWSKTGENILWWSPDPRFALLPDQLKVSKSMRNLLKKPVFSFTENSRFEEVISFCQSIPRKNQSGTWLCKDLLNSFVELHKEGKAHSIEVWHDKKLAGGFYGLWIGKIFSGESMFSKMSNASKAGFIHFVQEHKNYLDLVDCQVYSAHLESLGAKNISRKSFLEILHKQKIRP
ncbi:MAG: leucyl/phenylalanyl-tRNA--protein transferase [Bergeyella sp.]|nr:leucyl/phenylalanyl-tRNA--protein transferase [Bergeyella sp.]